MKMSLALALLIIGMVLLLIGLDSFPAIQSAYAHLFSGHFSNSTMWLVVGGSFSFVIGLVGCYHSRRI